MFIFEGLYVNINSLGVDRNIGRGQLPPAPLPPPVPTPLILYYLELNSGIGHNRTVASFAEAGFVRNMPSPFYTASGVIFQLQGCVVSHMQVLGHTPPKCT